MAPDSTRLSSFQPSEDLAGIPDEELLSRTDYQIPKKDSNWPGLSLIPSASHCGQENGIL